MRADLGLVEGTEVVIVLNNEFSITSYGRLMTIHIYNEKRLYG